MRYLGVITHLLTFDPNFQRDILAFEMVGLRFLLRAKLRKRNALQNMVDMVSWTPLQDDPLKITMAGAWCMVYKDCFFFQIFHIYQKIESPKQFRNCFGGGAPDEQRSLILFGVNVRFCRLAYVQQ